MVKDKSMEDTISNAKTSVSNPSNESTSAKNTVNESEEKEQQKEDTLKVLKKFFIKSVQDIYYAEHEIEEKLGDIKNKVTSEVLEDALEDHQLITKKQILRLEKVFKLLNETPKKNKCEAIVGILKEGDEMISQTKDKSTLRDIAIILACQKVEHYEIATYNGLIQLAVTLNLDKVVQLLETTYEEEEDTDHLLNDIMEEDIFITNDQE